MGEVPAVGRQILLGVLVAPHGPREAAEAARTEVDLLEAPETAVGRVGQGLIAAGGVVAQAPDRLVGPGHLSLGGPEGIVPGGGDPGPPAPRGGPSRAAPAHRAPSRGG